jgi:hypothetical protein
MNKPRRAAIGAAAALVLLAIAGALLVHWLSDPERLKRHAREKAREAWGRELTMRDLVLVWLPLPALHATDLTLAPAPGDEDPWDLHADRAVLGLELLPLLIGKATPRNLKLDGEVGHQGRKVKVTATLHDIAHYGRPDAASEGKVELDFGMSRVKLAGRIPLHMHLRGAALKAELESQGLNDLIGFFGIERPRATAPARATLALRHTGERIEVADAEATLGGLTVTGDARITTSGPKPVIDVRLQTERLDWAQALLESGDAPVAPLPPDQVLYDRPIAWPFLVAMKGKQGTIQARLGSLRVRNGIELRQVKADMTFDDDILEVKTFTANLLGGSAKAAMRFEGSRKAVRASVEGTHLLLERWFKERGSGATFTGGPMAITAKLAATGDSMRGLSKAMSGTVAIRMGPGVYVSEKAGNAEAKMVSFSKKGAAGGIAFECASGVLPFIQGRAAGDAIIGARSHLTRLLTSGQVSMREVAVDLRGRLRKKPGLGPGYADIAKDLRISGNMRNMKVSLDPADAGKRTLRAGAAIATLGLSVAASSAADASQGDVDPCAAVFEAAHR